MLCDFLAGAIGRKMRCKRSDGYAQLPGDFFCPSEARGKLYRLGITQEREVLCTRRDQPLGGELSAKENLASKTLSRHAIWRDEERDNVPNKWTVDRT